MNLKKTLFSIYSYFNNVLFVFLDLLPPFLRQLIFKLICGKFGKNSYIDYKTFIRYSKKLFIHDNVSINRGCKVFASYFSKDVKITIHDNVLIGPETVFFSAGHDVNSENFDDTAGSIVIEKNVWIGGNSTILQNVVIGEGSVIAAGSIVTKSVPKYSIVGGAPAKIIKKREING